MNQYETYYLNQAGSGIATYTGLRYQKGNGFFGRIMKGFALPLFKYFGKQGLSAAGNLVSEFRANPDKGIKELLKDQAKTSLSNITQDGADRLTKFIQTGKGVKRTNNKRSNKRTKGSIIKSQTRHVALVTPSKKRKSKADTFLL